MSIFERPVGVDAQGLPRPTVGKAAPVLLCSDIERSIAYYRDMLGFDRQVGVYGEPPFWAILWRDDVAIMLGDTKPGTEITPHWKLREKTCNVYIWVEDARAIYNEFVERGVELDFDIYEAPHGCLEFGVSDPDGHDIVFGQVID